jgi:hypothetical protein
MPSDLTALASRMVVAAASTDDSSTDVWQTARRRVAGLLGGGDKVREQWARRWLDQTRNQLQDASGDELKQVRAALEAVWRTRLADLLVEDPGAADKLWDLVRQVKAELPGSERTTWRDALQPIPMVIGWYRANVFAGILLAAGFVILKGYVIARGDLATALGILQYAGLATVLTAGLLSGLPILAAAMVAFTFIHMIQFRGAPGRHRRWWVMLGALVLAAVFTPWLYLVLATGIGLGIGAMRRLPHPPKWFTWLVYAVVAILAVPAVILSLYTVWVPHEKVHFEPGVLPPNMSPPNVQVGYVLSEDNGWITMLTSGVHQIVRYPDADVIAQTVCERQPSFSHPWSEVKVGATVWDEATSWTHFLHPAINPACPY